MTNLLLYWEIELNRLMRKYTGQVLTKTKLEAGMIGKESIRSGHD